MVRVGQKRVRASFPPTSVLQAVDAQACRIPRKGQCLDYVCIEERHPKMGGCVVMAVTKGGGFHKFIWFAGITHGWPLAGYLVRRATLSISSTPTRSLSRRFAVHTTLAPALRSLKAEKLVSGRPRSKGNGKLHFFRNVSDLSEGVKRCHAAKSTSQRAICFALGRHQVVRFYLAAILSGCNLI